jgi:hypothetical protein
MRPTNRFRHLDRWGNGGSPAGHAFDNEVPPFYREAPRLIASRSSTATFCHFGDSTMADRPAGIRPTTSQSGKLARCRIIIAFGFRAGPTIS